MKGTPSGSNTFQPVQATTTAAPIVNTPRSYTMDIAASPRSAGTSARRTHSTQNSNMSLYVFLYVFVFLTALFAGLFGWSFVNWHNHPHTNNADCISTDDIRDAQAAWGGAVVAIGNAWMDEGCVGALREANGALDAAYSFDDPLLFKPTLTTKPNTYRPTRDGALSYFVGQCAPVVTNGDNGFALGYSVGKKDDTKTWQGFTKVEFSDMTFHVGGEYCGAPVAQGRMTYYSRYTKLSYSVDKTFVYKRNPKAGGIPLLTVHHSSMTVPPSDSTSAPHEPDESETSEMQSVDSVSAETTPPTATGCITIQDINLAQEAWANALINVGNAWNSGTDNPPDDDTPSRCQKATAQALGALHAAYAYNETVLFKPTLTQGSYTFRNNHAGALSYFVGECVPRYGVDNGFALGYSVSDKPSDKSTWQGFDVVNFKQMKFLVSKTPSGPFCNAAVAQGKMSYRSRYTGKYYTVDKTFVYIKSKKANPALKAELVTHHSSVEVAKSQEYCNLFPGDCNPDPP